LKYLKPIYSRSSHDARLILTATLTLLFGASAAGQTLFKGVVINSIDSSVIPYAAVSIKETDKSVLTDDKGGFSFAIPGNIRSVTLSIAAIGIKNTVVFHYPFDSIEKVYVDVTANSLTEFSVKGLSAEEVVKIAVASIPANYADSSYFDYSFYRRYQKLNGRFVNLFEAYPVVMFRLSKGRKAINSKEAFAVTQLRRTTFHPDIMNASEDNPIDLVTLNPVYHLEQSSLNPEKFPNYHFSFDTTSKTKDYVINYVCNDFATDIHGMVDFAERDLKGEEWEKGELVIDRTSFAIKKFHRKSLRHKDYTYKMLPIPNNLIVYDGHKYFFEFIGGDLDAEYEQRGGKWYLEKITRQYTHEFYTPVFNEKAFSITDNFEWYSDSISRYTTGDFVNRFYSKMATAIHGYDTGFWANSDFPFYYSDKETIYKDLLRDGPLATQFRKETGVDEYVRKKQSEK